MTGSMTEQYAKDCQYYEITQNKWHVLPQLNVGRATHASCTFGGRWVMVYGGLSKGSRINSIERLDMFSKDTWQLIAL